MVTKTPIYITPVTEDQRDHHFYPTPEKLCSAALDLLPDDFKPNRILDPGAGAGVWGTAARWKWVTPNIDGIEIRNNKQENLSGYDRMMIADYLTYGFYNFPKYDLIMGNPPFFLAQKFVERSLELVGVTGRVLFLLPINFLGTQVRSAWLWKEAPPISVHVAIERPSFKDGVKRDGSVRKGSTDIGKEYVVAQWLKGYTGQTTITGFNWK